jgi:hypothetical protein
MKAKIFAISLIAILALLLSGPATAQGPQPPAPPYPTQEPGLPPGAQPWEPEFGKPFIRPGAPSMGIQSAGAASIPLGQPGLSFRYVQTFGITGEPYLADGNHLNSPNGLFIDGGNNLYVVEEKGHRLLKYNTFGANTLIIGHAGSPWHHDDYLSWPKDVAADSAGNIWVLFSPTVKKFDAAGNPLLTIPETNPWESGNDNYHFNDPRGIAFDNMGRLFVSDTRNHRIQVYDVSGSEPVYVLTIGTTGVPKSDNTGFNQPAQIAFDSSGRLYVVDTANYRVQRCTKNPGPPETWTCSTFFGVTGVPGSDLTHMGWAYGITIKNDNIYIADSSNYRVLKCDITGTCSHFAGTTGEPGWDNAHFGWPADVAVDSSGNVYVSDWDNHRVQKFNSAGEWVSTIGVTRVPYVTDAAHLNRPWGIAAAPDGSIYVTENGGYRLIKLSAAGVQQWTVGQAGVYGNDNAHLGNWWAGPEGNLAIDAAGRIYVPDTGNHRIQVFNPNGSYFTTFGSYGNGPNQFDCPAGVAISPVNGDIFVVDRCNQRIQVYTSGFVYKTTLGVLDETGTDNRHFNWPWGVAVDASGNIYVADTENHRVQKCTLSGTSYSCITFVGETGVFNDDFWHLHPLAVAVDNAGRVYVVDEWNNRVQVFDSAGAYLTTIGGSWGARTGELRGPSGIAVDSAGNVYVTDRDNHRIQKFAPGVPGWKQVNINGFGDPANRISTLGVFGGYLYAGTYAFRDHGAQLWRTADGLNWTAVMTNGFGVYYNVGIDHLVEFNGKLYAGVWNSTPNPPYTDTGGEIWRSSDGTSWEPVVQGGFGDRYNGEVMRLAVFNNQIYAATWSYTSTHGAEIWRSSTGNAGDWTRVVSNGLGDATNQAVLTMEVFNGALYAGTYSWGSSPNGADVWRFTEGSAWTTVITNGFGYTGTYAVSSLAAFGDYLYAGIGRYDLATQSYPGGQIWRCSGASGCDEPGDWSVVITDGFGGAAWNISSLVVFAGRLYAVGFHPDGLGVWRTADGTHWEQVGFAGFGDSNNISTYWDNATAVFNNRLYIGTINGANGGEVWLFLHNRLYLPLVLRNR